MRRRQASLLLVLALLFLSGLARPAWGQIVQDGALLQSSATATGNGQTMNVGGYAVATIEVTTLSGTATIVPEATIDSQSATPVYTTLTCIANDGVTSVTSFTATGTWRCNVTGFNLIRARISACGSCTVSVQATKWVSGQVSWLSPWALSKAAYILQYATPPLKNAQALSTLDTGLLKNTTGTGVLSIGVSGTDYVAPTTAVNTSSPLGGGGALTGNLTLTCATCLTTGSTLTLSSSTFANQGTTTTVLHGNAAGNPSWAAVNLSSDVTGTVGAANGGTNLNTSASTGVPSISAGTWSVASALATTLGGTGVNTSQRFKLLPGNTRDLSLASSTQSIAHGVTGTPKAVLLLVSVESGSMLSLGFSDGTANFCNRWVNNATNMAQNVFTTQAAHISTTAAGADTDNQVATVTFDATNVNLVWTKTGAPTGTAQINMLVFF